MKLTSSLKGLGLYLNFGFLVATASLLLADELLLGISSAVVGLSLMCTTHYLADWLESQ
jgi:hypothetical protein